MILIEAVIVIIVVIVATVIFIIMWETKSPLCETKSKPEPAREPRWEVRVETRGGYLRWSEETKDWTDRYDAVVVCCVLTQDNSRYEYFSRKVDIDCHDAARDDLMEVIPKLVAKAEIRCAELNALGVR